MEGMLYSEPYEYIEDYKGVEIHKNKADDTYIAYRSDGKTRVSFLIEELKTFIDDNDFE